ncbi:hypothetical protein QOK74_08305 [Staphylococcus saprophyticus]|uniref:hypothetical protein n=1 Tax=Staphylococcus saprophyticus TaxID=29385 RepID=UPI0024C37F50|nr:hypothetical protein [Staphylococcus saprophyticus]MDK1672873.1 hypothetical protein [Staphylococcus saprophyticus]
MTEETKIYNIDEDYKEKLIHVIENHDLEIEIFDGVLANNYILHNYGNITIEKQSPKFIIIKEIFINTWSSGLEMILTNSENVYMNNLQMFESNN